MRPGLPLSRLYRQSRIQLSQKHILIGITLALVAVGCGEIPNASPTGDTTVVDPFGFSILVDTSLVNDGWDVREFAYSPARTQHFRSVRFPVVYEMFVDRPSFNGRGFQPLDQPGPRIERGLRATRLVIRVLGNPGIEPFDALVDTVRNLNQNVSVVALNGLSGFELSTAGGNSNDPVIYTWSHTEEMVPRMVF